MASNPYLHKLLFVAADFLRGDRSLSKFKVLNRAQYWNNSILSKWQLDRLNIILEHARNNSPFYAKRLAKIALPIKDFQYLQDIPLLTKQEILRNTEEIKSKNIGKKRFIPANTGGSTGEPLHYFSDRLSLGWRRAAVLRNSQWAGLSLGEKNVQMTGSHYEYTKRQNLNSGLKLWLLNGINMPAVALSDNLLESYYRRVGVEKPASIWGYASALYYFAKFIQENHPGAELGFIKAIITSSETLYPYQRETIGMVFGQGKVFDHYGSSEFYIAAECCCHNGYHINADIFNLEITDKDGLRKKPGESGKVILTDFYNFAFPFIRYEIGDIGRLAENITCACGVALPKLEKIEGRIADAVVLQDRILTPPNFTNIFRAFKGVDQYQIVQKTLSELDVNVVKNNDFEEKFAEHILKSFKIVLGETARVNINYVDAIKLPKSGKRRYIISEVAKSAL